MQISKPLPEDKTGRDAPRDAIAAASSLHYGNAKRPMVRVVPDAQHPDLFRMHWPDGQLSDMTNLARAKDAAAEICDRGPPRRDRRRFR